MNKKSLKQRYYQAWAELYMLCFRINKLGEQLTKEEEDEKLK